jgi:hypothetical protein
MAKLLLLLLQAGCQSGEHPSTPPHLSSIGSSLFLRLVQLQNQLFSSTLSLPLNLIVWREVEVAIIFFLSSTFLLFFLSLTLILLRSSFSIPQLLLYSSLFPPVLDRHQPPQSILLPSSYAAPSSTGSEFPADWLRFENHGRQFVDRVSVRSSR